MVRRLLPGMAVILALGALAPQARAQGSDAGHPSTADITDYLHVPQLLFIELDPGAFDLDAATPEREDGWIARRRDRIAAGGTRPYGLTAATEPSAGSRSGLSPVETAERRVARGDGADRGGEFELPIAYARFPD
jgi:hypothetical protein